MRLVLAIAISLCMLQPVLASETAPLPGKPSKLETFKTKHPKMYWAVRKGRTICIFCKPFVELGVLGAQLGVQIAGLL